VGKILHDHHLGHPLEFGFNHVVDPIPEFLYTGAPLNNLRPLNTFS
jgi:hypothetical protein